jgi:hypothetical protein
MNFIVFWDVAPCSKVYFDRRFRGAYCLNHQGDESLINFRTLHPRRRHLDSLFLINVFKGKINCPCILDTVGIRVPTRQIREFYTFNVSSALKHSPSSGASLLLMTFSDILTFSKKNYIYFEDTFSERETV